MPMFEGRPVEMTNPLVLPSGSPLCRTWNDESPTRLGWASYVITTIVIGQDKIRQGLNPLTAIANLRIHRPIPSVHSG